MTDTRKDTRADTMADTTTVRSWLAKPPMSAHVARRDYLEALQEARAAVRDARGALLLWGDDERWLEVKEPERPCAVLLPSLDAAANALETAVADLSDMLAKPVPEPSPEPAPNNE